MIRRSGLVSRSSFRMNSSPAIGCAALCLVAACLGACTTRTVVLTNTSDQAAELSATETTDGWDYSRILEPGESFRLRIGKGQQINLPEMSIRVE